MLLTSARRRMVPLLVALLAANFACGCGSSEPMADTATVQDKSIEESTLKSSSKKKRKDPAPTQRLKNGLE